MLRFSEIMHDESHLLGCEGAGAAVVAVVLQLLAEGLAAVDPPAETLPGGVGADARGVELGQFCAAVGAYFHDFLSDK